jgi:dynamin 1-like protein
MVQNIVNIEMSYINTSHPDFIGGSRALTHLALLKKQKAQQAARQAVENGTDYGTTPEEQQQILLQEDQARFMKQIQAHKEQMAAQHGGAGKYEFHSQFGNFTTEQVQLYSEMPPSEREMVEIDVIKLLIASYFGIVKKTIKDTVPKAIMYHLVNKTKEDIQSELVRELYKESEFPTLLKEADDISEKRAACTKLIKVMRKAYEIVSRIKDLSL